jgi:hypothetical protein
VFFATAVRVVFDAAGFVDGDLVAFEAPRHVAVVERFLAELGEDVMDRFFRLYWRSF